MASGWVPGGPTASGLAAKEKSMTYTCSMTSRLGSTSFPPLVSLSRQSSFDSSQVWELGIGRYGDMTHMAPKISRSLSDKLFRRTSESSRAGSLQAGSKLGLLTLYDPPAADLDILFVHGITGHRENTWAAPGSRPWPEQLLPTKLPRARILSYGYDAGVISFGWRSRLSGNRVGDHARSLLVSIAAHREATETNDRPLLFVCHSLGGLVCEDSLLSSAASPERHLRQIFSQTRGILFLGTPHSGTGLAVVGQRLARLAGLVSGTNARLVEVLRRDSEVLARIQDEFHALLRSPRGSTIGITCVYEEVIMQSIGEVVVPRYSATLPGYPAIGIHANHRDIARFKTAADPGFITVANELQRWAREVREESELSQRKPSDVTAITTADPEGGGSGGGVGGGGGGGGWGGGGGQSNNLAGVTIYGNVLQSVVVNGGQIVNGGIVFGD